MWRSPQIDALYNEDVDIGKCTNAKKAKWYQVGLIELGRYAALASTIAAGTTGLPGCCPSYKPFNDENPFNYAAKADCECNEQWEQGKHLKSLVTRTGWAVRAVNGAAAAVSSAALGSVAGEGGREAGRDFWKYTYGGEGFDEVCGEFFKLKFKEFYDLPLDKKLIVGASIAAPIVLPLTLHHGHHAGAAAVRRPSPRTPPF